MLHSLKTQDRVTWQPIMAAFGTKLNQEIWYDIKIASFIQVYACNSRQFEIIILDFRWRLVSKKFWLILDFHLQL